MRVDDSQKESLETAGDAESPIDAEARQDQRQFREFAEQPEVGFFAEFWGFLRHNKKWWLVPLLLSLLFVAVVAALGNSPLAPFIYSLF